MSTAKFAIAPPTLLRWFEPWRAPQAEEKLADTLADTTTFNAAASAVLDGARGFGGNDFKIPLTRRTLHSVLAETTRT